MISIHAREEVDFEADGTVALTDMETGEEVRISMTRQTIGSYHQALQEHQEALQKLAKRYGCRFLSVVSDENMDKVLFETLQQKGIFG